MGEYLLRSEKLGSKFDEPITREPGTKKTPLKTFFAVVVAIIADFGYDFLRGRAVTRLPDEFQIGKEITSSETPAQMTHRQIPARQAGQQNGLLKILFSDSKLKATSFPKSFQLVAHNLHINHDRQTL